MICRNAARFLLEMSLGAAGFSRSRTPGVFGTGTASAFANDGPVRAMDDRSDRVRAWVPRSRQSLHGRPKVRLAWAIRDTGDMRRKGEPFPRRGRYL